MTAPYTWPTPVSVAVYIDGVRLDDGSEPVQLPGRAVRDLDPVALSGLKVTWGRGTTVDQIQPSTCSFDVADPAGGDSFLGLLYVGAAVDVHAYGDVPAPATLPINADPGFETAAPGSAPPTWQWTAGELSSVAVTAAAAATGAQSVQLVGPTGGTKKWATLEMYPDVPDHDDPAGWDHLPPLQTGEHWASTVTVKAPAGTALSLISWGTKSNGSQVYNLGGTAELLADGTWQTMTASFTVPAAAAGLWLSIRLDINWAIWNTTPGTWQDQTGTWNDLRVIYLDDVEMLAPASADTVHRDALVFSGRVTDLDASWDENVDGLVCSVVAQDFPADLANRDVGAEPWPAETLAARFGRITAAGGVPVPYTLAPTLRNYRVSYLDVDRQQVWPLLADLATSVDGVLWSAAHASTGPYLWLTDPRTQSALYVLQLDDTSGLVVIEPTAASSSAVTVDACDVLLEPVTFRQTVGDVVTRVALTWQEQTVDDQGLPAPTDRTVTVIDAAAETAGGTRRLGVSTLLADPAPAQQVAELILARLRPASWRVAGLTWRTGEEMTGEQANNSLDLLDGTRRIGVAVLLTNLPDWAPSGGATLPLLLQGGVYTFDDGRWTLDLVTSSAAAQGTGVAWQDLDPAWTWNDFDPAIVWTDLVGVTV